jgi:hypothetical protein
MLQAVLNTGVRDAGTSPWKEELTVQERGETVGKRYEAVVIGTGFGGAITGCWLAKK